MLFRSDATDKDGNPKLRVYLKNDKYQKLLGATSKLYVGFKKIKAECGMG